MQKESEKYLGNFIVAVLCAFGFVSFLYDLKRDVMTNQKEIENSQKIGREYLDEINRNEMRRLYETNGEQLNYPSREQEDSIDFQ